MTKVGVLLSGCGVFDGAEIHEAVLTLLALDSAGCKAICMAPDVEQMHVIDHRTGEAVEERRNVLTESARIARGKIRPLAGVRARELDALLLPGGFGAAKNLCDFAARGVEASVQEDVARLLGEMLAARKPIGAMCIAPATLAAVLRDLGLAAELTIGDDPETASALGRMGVHHALRAVGARCVDLGRKIVTTPAYMLAQGIAEAADGIDRLVEDVLALVEERAEASV